MIAFLTASRKGLGWALCAWLVLPPLPGRAAEGAGSTDRSSSGEPKIPFEQACPKKEADPPPQLVAGKGLLLSEVTRKALRIETAPVIVHDLTPQLSGSAQVYQGAAERAQPSSSTRPGLAYATVFIDPRTAEKLKVGNLVRLRHKGQPPQEGTERSGKIFQIDQELVPVTGQAELLIEFPDPSSDFPVGTWIEFTTPLGSDASHLAVPQSALLATAEGNFVYVWDGRFYRRTPITLSFSTDGLVAIVGDPPAGTPVVSHGAEDLWLLELSLRQGLTRGSE
ncbi:efflux RND transporter periplasmic adaptor subunit [Methylacidimicrobium sp. B4]|uniref:efflux RND transporter periplasmic adaptor subunit n=1 Tax=Methylacidimicrobium sp. B4 TaxID=2796139 RepID=UPI001A9049A8|nr:efflux RND transporter periplasmic adaptor subunit [Methylacidimicrobium sp. B4]QSR84765.1 efflux RND transporter periplasmic adaptor subunit [Methylacidimicrobium sp. B4]